MSFSSDTKQVLVEESAQMSKCCKQTLLYGMLQGGRMFKASEISLQTKSSEVADLYEKLLHTCGKVRTVREKKGFHVVAVRSEQCEQVLDRYNHHANDVSMHLQRGCFDCDKCISSYLRGLFLTCGNLSNPEREYRLEMNIPSYTLCQDVQLLLEENDMPAKHLRRGGDNVLYYRGSEKIEDFLTFIGAGSVALKIMEIKVLKDVRNRLNRENNCYVANEDKRAVARTKQVEAIQNLLRSGKANERLTDDLKEVAVLRYQNPEMSLAELAQLCNPPLTKSGIHHRMERLLAIAESED